MPSPEHSVLASQQSFASRLIVMHACSPDGRAVVQLIPSDDRSGAEGADAAAADQPFAGLGAEAGEVEDPVGVGPAVGVGVGDLGTPAGVDEDG